MRALIQQSATKMSQRGLRPACELAENRPHGDRLRYIGGCRCDSCRAANTAYERSRNAARAAGDWNGIVSADKARRHIKKLSKLGVGRRAIQAATDIANTVLCEIRSGKKKNIRARTERLILGVTTDVRGDAFLVPAGPAWALIDELLAAGYTKSEVAFGIGRKTPALQLNKTTITLRNEAAVKRLHAKLIQPEQGMVNSTKAARLIDQLRSEWFPASRIAAELGMPEAVEFGAFVLPKRIACELETRIVALHQRLMN